MAYGIWREPDELEEYISHLFLFLFSDFTVPYNRVIDTVFLRHFVHSEHHTGSNARCK